MTDDKEWLERARCKGMNTAEWFPSGQGEHTSRQYERLRRICAVCPVKAECLAEAMRFETSVYERSGMFGGLAPGERRKLAASGVMPMPKPRPGKRMRARPTVQTDQAVFEQLRRRWLEINEQERRAAGE